MAQHVVAFRAVLERLRESGLVLNGEKCVIGVDNVLVASAIMEQHVVDVRAVLGWLR